MLSVNTIYTYRRESTLGNFETDVFRVAGILPESPVLPESCFRLATLRDTKRWIPSHLDLFITDRNGLIDTTAVR